MPPVAEAETAIKRPRAAGYMTGAALLLSGLALNPLAFAHFLPADSLGKQAVLGLQVALMVGGGLVGLAADPCCRLEPLCWFPPLLVCLSP